MEKILFTGKDLTSSVELPVDVRKMLSFIATWGCLTLSADGDDDDDNNNLSLWYDDTYINIYQTNYGLWTLYEATKFKTDLIAAGIAYNHCDFVFSSEKIHCPSCDYEEHVTALCIRRRYIIR